MTENGAPEGIIDVGRQIRAEPEQQQDRAKFIEELEIEPTSQVAVRDIDKMERIQKIVKTSSNLKRTYVQRSLKRRPTLRSL